MIYGKCIAWIIRITEHCQWSLTNSFLSLSSSCLYEMSLGLHCGFSSDGTSWISSSIWSNYRHTHTHTHTHTHNQVNTKGQLAFEIDVTSKAMNYKRSDYAKLPP